MLLGVSLVASVPHVADAIQYERSEVLSGETWRLLTGQIVHWSWGMTCADLGTIALAGGWLETRSRRLAVSAAALSAALVAVALLVARPDVAFYRGASGIAVGLTVAAALELARAGPSRWLRRAGAALFALLLVKAAAEMITGASFLPGTLPEGIALVPETHLAGAAGGILAVMVPRVLARGGITPPSES